MNFLAHMYLSCSNEDLLIGNFVADFIRNRDLVLYSDAIVKGIDLHRKIDHYTDNHPRVVRSTRILRAQHGKYAPVVIDVCYDYILSKNWSKYSGETLRAFSDRVYEILKKNHHSLPDHLQDIAPRMIKDDFLIKYGTEAGLRRTFERIEKRAKFSSNWSTAFDDLIRHYDELEDGFNSFFPDMIAVVDDFCDC